MMDGSLVPRGHGDLERHKRFVPFSFIINFIVLELFSRGVEDEKDLQKVKAWVDANLPPKAINARGFSPIEDFFNSLSPESIDIIIEALKNIKASLTSREILERKNPLILTVDAHERINIALDYLKSVKEASRDDEDEDYDPAKFVSPARVDEYDSLQKRLSALEESLGQRIKKCFKPFLDHISDALVRDLRIGDEKKSILINKIRVECDRIVIVLQEGFIKLDRKTLTQSTAALDDFLAKLPVIYLKAREPVLAVCEYLLALEAWVSLKLWINHLFKKDK